MKQTLKETNNKPIAIAVSIFVLISIAFLWQYNLASGRTVSFEAEKNANQNLIKSDSSASGGKFVVFSNQSDPDPDPDPDPGPGPGPGEVGSLPGALFHPLAEWEGMPLDFGMCCGNLTLGTRKVALPWINVNNKPVTGWAHMWRYPKPNSSEAGYGKGDGGRYRISVVGSKSNGLPNENDVYSTGTVDRIAGLESFRPSLKTKAWWRMSRMDLNSIKTPKVGDRYWTVVENIHENPTKNYISINNWHDTAANDGSSKHTAVLTPQELQPHMPYPVFTPFVDEGNGFKVNDRGRNNGPFAVYYSDGSAMGNLYHNAMGKGPFNFGGSKTVTQTFTATANRTITEVSATVLSLDNSPKTLTVKVTAGGKSVTGTTVPLPEGSNQPGRNRSDPHQARPELIRLDNSIAIKKGQKVTVELSSAGSVQIQALEHEDASNSAPGTNWQLLPGTVWDAEDAKHGSSSIRRSVWPIGLR